MKKIVLVFIVLLLCKAIAAQNLFAPIGAEWYHNGSLNKAVYHSNVTKDTVIDGVKCNLIEQEVLLDSFYRAIHYPAKATRNLYVYDANDTVFIYNERHKRFTPLYIFNVNAGDTVRIESIIPSDFAVYYNNDTNLSGISFIIDSVGIKNYDGVALRTVYSHFLKEKISSGGWTSSTNIYAEKLGSIYAGILPTCVNDCMWLTISGGARLDSVLCYKDSSLDLHFTSTSCDKGYKPVTSIVEKKGGNNSLDLYPNPATGLVSVSAESLIYNAELIAYDAMGRLVLQQKYSKGSKCFFDTKNWSSGLYYIRLTDDQNNILGRATLLKE